MGGIMQDMQDKKRNHTRALPVICISLCAVLIACCCILADDARRAPAAYGDEIEYNTDMGVNVSEGEEYGKPIEGAVVYIVQDIDHWTSNKTSDEGSTIDDMWTNSGVPVGQCLVFAFKSGYEPYEETKQIRQDTVSLPIALTKSGGSSGGSGGSDGPSADGDNPVGDNTPSTGSGAPDSANTGASTTSGATADTTPDIDIAQAKASNLPDRQENGRIIQPQPTLTMSGAALKAGRDYALYFKDNEAAGVATVAVEGKGGYTGEKLLTFNILPKKMALTATRSGRRTIVAEWAEYPGMSYTVGYREPGKEWKSSDVPAGRTRLALKHLGAGKTYQLRIRAKKTDNGRILQSSWSRIRTVR
jgi:hypothetical protein